MFGKKVLSKNMLIKNKFIKYEQGYTLIELLIITAVAGILISAIMTFFIINFRTFNRETDDLRAQTQASKAIEFLTEKIIETRGNIATVGTESTSTFTVSFQRGIPDNSFIAFHFDETNQKLSFGEASTRQDAIDNATAIVAEQISNFFIVHTGGSRIVTIKVESSTSNNVVELESKVSLRNFVMP